jgi:predicted HTH transcriptional regulator
MIDKHSLFELIAGGENSTVEFKRKSPSPQKLAKEISALANTKGGYLFLGVDDDGSICGVHSEKTSMDEILTACEFHLDPEPVYEMGVINHKKKYIVVAHIQQSKNKPHRVIFEDIENKKNVKRAYIRIGEKSVEASSEMARLMRYQNKDSGKDLKINVGEKEKRLFVYLEKHERITVKDYCNLVNIGKRTAERSLVALVRAGTMQIHNDTTRDYFTLV